jgi:DNA-binding transcriptional MerR regulator
VLISEASEKYDISPDTLRYYERIGLLPPVRRSKSGLRDYDENDLMWIDFIKCMRSAGLPIEQLARYVQLFPQGDATVEARKKILQDQREQIRARIAELQRTLDLLDHKIAMYEKGVIPAERELLAAKDSSKGTSSVPQEKSPSTGT